MPPVPTAIAVTPDTVLLTALRQTAQFTAEVRDQVGRLMENQSASSSATDPGGLTATQTANDPIISSRDTEIGSYSFAALGAREERDVPLTISVDARSAAGTIYIGMCVDAVTDEPNTRNNCSDGARLTIAALSTGRGQAAIEQSAIRIRAYGPAAGKPERDRKRDGTR